jgi:hypothetical protein
MDILGKRWAGFGVLVKIPRCFNAGFTMGRSGMVDQEEPSPREIDVMRAKDR